MVYSRTQWWFRKCVRNVILAFLTLSPTHIVDFGTFLHFWHFWTQWWFCAFLDPLVVLCISGLVGGFVRVPEGGPRFQPHKTDNFHKNAIF